MLKEIDLNQFTGSEHWYKHLLSGFSFTDGILYLAKEGGAFWLIDKILISMRHNKIFKKVEYQEFTVWTLTINRPANEAILTAEDGNKHQIYKEKIEYTDFPLDKISLWFENGVLILPSEH